MMSDMDEPASHPAKRLWLAVVAIVLVVASPAMWFVFIDDAVMRRTGAAVWPPLALGLAMAIAAWIRDRRRRTRLASAVALTLALLMGVSWIVLTRLPSPTVLPTLKHAPPFTLMDHTATARSLDAMLANGPLLLVFYRGHW